MYIDYYDLHFGKKDYLHFNNVKFTRGGSGHLAYMNTEYKVYTIQLSIKYNEQEKRYIIYVNFIDKDISDNASFTKLLIYRDESTNKTILLLRLRKIMRFMYNVMCLCKQYMNIIKFDDNSLKSIVFSTTKYNSAYSLVTLFEHNTEILVNDDNLDIHNTILSTSRLDVKRPVNEIVIDNNIIYLYYNIAVYPKSFNYNLNKKLQSVLGFCCSPYMIHRDRLEGPFGINYFIPFQLLIKFIDNIELFNNVNKMYVNNEYDLLKYI